MTSTELQQRAEVRALRQAARDRSGSGTHGRRSRRSDRRRDRQALRRAVREMD